MSQVKYFYRLLYNIRSQNSFDLEIQYAQGGLKETWIELGEYEESRSQHFEVFYTGTILSQSLLSKSLADYYEVTDTERELEE